MYNSNGYIMLDFSMLDFSRTNQIIDGIYQRVFEIVGINKFVLILNAQSKTPLPACVSFVNSSYVIESFLYNFAITLDDNVRIENVSSDLIKDGIVSAATTWSSSKINNEILSLIDDDDISDSGTWSSEKIDDALSSISLNGLFKYSKSVGATINISAGSTVSVYSYDIVFSDVDLTVYKPVAVNFFTDFTYGGIVVSIDIDNIGVAGREVLKLRNTSSSGGYVNYNLQCLFIRRDAL